MLAFAYKNPHRTIFLQDQTIPQQKKEKPQIGVWPCLRFTECRVRITLTLREKTFSAAEKDFSFSGKRCEPQRRHFSLLQSYAAFA